MFQQDFQTLENNKNTRPSASCFHQLSRVWKPWWNTRPLLWNIASLPCEDITFRVKAYNYLVFIGVLYHRFRWGISFSIRFKPRSISTFSFASANVILLFSQGKAHPLQKTLTLLACKSSGTLTQQEAFCKKLPKSSCTLRKGVHRRSVPFTSRSGCSRALQSHSNTSFRFYDGSFLTRPGLQCYEHS